MPAFFTGRLEKTVAGLTFFLMTEQLERLALGGWGDAAEAQVVSVTVAGNRAEVALRVDAYEYWMYFKRGVDGSWSCEPESSSIYSRQ